MPDSDHFASLEPGQTTVTITDRPKPSGDVARYQKRGQLYNWSGYIVISGYHDLNQGGTSTGYEVPPGDDPGQGTEYGVWQREPGRHNYSVRAVSYGYTAEGDFAFRAEATEAIQLTTADSFTSAGTVQIFDADGNLIATICARRYCNAV